jgi:FkbM family methyltransferase
MADLFDKALHYLGQTQKDKVFAINIGAMDGVMFDEMYAYATMYGFRGLYVEPIPYLFEKLKKYISPDNLFENSAISSYDGDIEMITIDQEPIDNGLIHKCFYGMSAICPAQNGLGSEGDKPTIEKYGKIIKVPCITFNTLMTKHNLTNFDILKIDAEGHDYEIFKQIDFYKYKPKVIRIEWISLASDKQTYIINTFVEHGYVYEILEQDMTAILTSLLDEIRCIDRTQTQEVKERNQVTLITGLWNIGRSDLSEGWSKQYQDYLDKFSQLLAVDTNMIIFGNEELKSFVMNRRNDKNTQFIVRDLNWFKNNDYYDKIQQIRENEQWYEQAHWLKNSPQAKLCHYNPIVMSKMFLLNDARILDKFNSDYMFWIDAGISFTVHPGYFTHDRVLLKLSKYIHKFTFFMFPYETNSEIHGFRYDKICTYAGDKHVNKVARGGFFGGPKGTITQINSIYYSLLIRTLTDGYMGTEESIFTIISYKYPDITNYIEIMGDGLLCKFFEDLKNDNVLVKSNCLI